MILNQINLTTVFILNNLFRWNTHEIKFCIHNLYDVIHTYYFEMFLHHAIVIPHVSFFLCVILTVSEPARWTGKTRKYLTEIWFCDQSITEGMSPTSDWNTYQHFERCEYEVENVCVLNFTFSGKFAVIYWLSFPSFWFLLYFSIPCMAANQGSQIPCWKIILHLKFENPVWKVCLLCMHQVPQILGCYF